MKKHSTALAVVMMLVCALSACGGGGGSSGSAQATAATQPASTLKPVLIESYGDSTTAGYETVNGAGIITPNSEPADLQNLLRARIGSNVTISNQGVGGTEASELLNGMDGVHPTWINQMAASKASVVTLNFGLNDAYYSQIHNGAVAESPADYANDMTQLIQIARASGKEVVLYEPSPTCDPVREPLMPLYVQALRSVAAAQNAPIVGEYESISAIQGWQSMLTDCLHPDDALYAIKAQLELPVVAPLVQKLEQ